MLWPAVLPLHRSLTRACRPKRGVGRRALAVPMAARVSQMVVQKYCPGNFLLMNAMGPNVAGVIGSAVAAGYFMLIFGK